MLAAADLVAWAQLIGFADAPSWPAAKSLLSATGCCTSRPASPAAPANDGYASTPPGAGPKPSPPPGSASAPPSPNQQTPPRRPERPTGHRKARPTRRHGPANTPQPRKRYPLSGFPAQHPRTPPARKSRLGTYWSDSKLLGDHRRRPTAANPNLRVIPQSGVESRV